MCLYFLPQAHGCPGWDFVDDCSHHNVYTAVFFGIHSLVFLFTALHLMVMFDNYRFQVSKRDSSGSAIQRYSETRITRTARGSSNKV